MRACVLDDRTRALAVLRVLGRDDDVAIARAWQIEAQLAGDNNTDHRNASGLIAAILERRAGGYRVAARDVQDACAVASARELRASWPEVAAALTDPIHPVTTGRTVPAPTVSWSTSKRGAA
jgi:hypothetical protein